MFLFVWKSTDLRFQTVCISSILFCVSNTSGMSKLFLSKSFSYNVAGRAMAQALNRWAVIAEARVTFPASPRGGLWWTMWHWGKFFSEYFGFPFSL